jgi:methyl-accepting chemotaxis protein
MLNLTVKKQLIGSLLLTLLTLAIVGTKGYRNSIQWTGDIHDLVNTTQTLRNHLESDMMHDAIRGDVMTSLHAVYSGELDERAAIEADFDQHAENFRARLTENAAINTDPTTAAAIAGVKPVVETYIIAADRLITLAFADVAEAEAELPAFMTTFGELEDRMASVSDLIESSAAATSSRSQEASEASVTTMTWTIIVSILVGLTGSVFVTGSILRPINRLHDAIERIRSDRNSDVRLDGFKGEFLAIQHAFNGLLTRLTQEAREEAQRAQAAMRIQQALESATANVVLTDPAGSIIYINETARRLFEASAPGIRKVMPGFSPEHIVGTSLEALLPASLSRAIQATTAQRQDEVTMGDLIFQISSSVVTDENGNRLGIFCEWVDLTEQRDAERQIQAILQDAISGRLDTRLDISRFRGFTHTLSVSVNAMLDAISQPLAASAAQLKAIADGRIPEPITAQYEGTFDEIRNSLNTCSRVLKALVDDSTRLVNAASRGNLQERVNVNNHWGNYRAIVEGINNTLDAIVKPFTEVKEVLTGVSTGDLTRRMNGTYTGDFKLLSEAVKTSIVNLVDMVEKIANASSNISGGAAELSNGNQNLNERTQEQAAALEETTATLENLSERAEENTSHARRANELAQSATAEAQRGGAIVQKAVVAMADINKASQKISEIISVIDSIAFQTNLLALNASVEAARAGEQGRGFAVVANEVRALAQRSATAADEIKKLIGDSVEKVNLGSQLVNESGATLQDIVSSVSKVGVIISEISAATASQTDGFREVSSAITQLDDMTQQNAAMVEEAAAASETMASQAVNLTALIDFFKVGTNSNATDSRSRGRPTLVHAA